MWMHTYEQIVPQHQAAWFQKRMGVRNALEYQYALRYWSMQLGYEAIGALIDLEHCFPKAKRRAVSRILRGLGFPVS